MPGTDIMTHLEVILRPDPSRTVLRPFDLSDPDGFRVEGHSRAQRIVDRVMTLDAADLAFELERVVGALNSRHRHVEAVLLRRFDEVQGLTIDPDTLDRDHKLLIGAYFTEEYSFEAAALFNPSIVPATDQSGVPEGALRFAMSLRGIGEGHVSSVTFRTGVWSADGTVTIDRVSDTVVAPQILAANGDGEDTVVCIRCEGSEDPSETVLFPVTPSQRQGIEDLRMVRFVEDDGEVHYLGTYTAFSGSAARSEMLHAQDFRNFEMRALKGAAAQSKGMALFPRKIGGRYAMLGRQDNENVWLLMSDDLYTWETGEKLITPKWPWEFVQMGNCGSPIEIEEGWLVLTHGVGTVRTYCMGAALLDKDDPSKVLKRMTLPLVHPSPKERDGYVPNVVYSCGALVHDRTLLLPYGVADNFATFASVKLDTLLDAMA
ncbi:glycoside hydrolase family 130 protein [Sphingomonas sp. CROZ-RG-20F-R02-07]|uniref:glycoside hydrolase family 130 protein n=1 Tax=Sphingomonas sp. CROZ-RG-20F-R02-07 TaxID=2914832 RepID=UPI001F568A35|nr:glycoside hydrolase family 130 protein [Sphingomonas sp. CROZ-RG-20F-R02-07]